MISKIKIFADGADLAGITKMSSNSLISGFTTNPTLMRKAGVADYKSFAKDVIKIVTPRPVSFEVFADEFNIMEKQAMEIASWGENVNVKIPVTTTRGEFCGPLIKKLSNLKIKLNVTAIMTLEQVESVLDCLNSETPSMISVFAGRIADTGRDPIDIMSKSVELLKNKKKFELIWASPRELLNIFQAQEIGCNIITATNDILEKIKIINKDLEEYSLETVKMFYNDAIKAGYNIQI